MRALATEVSKLPAYRTVLWLAAGAIVVVAGWTLMLIRPGGSATTGPDLLAGSLAFTGLVMPIVWFVLPMLHIRADLYDGTLRPALSAIPSPPVVVGAKWLTVLGVGLGTAVAVWAAPAVVIAVRFSISDTPDLTAALLRLLVEAAVCVTLGMAVSILTGFRGASWIALVLVVWIQLVERILGSALPDTAGMLASPFRLIDFWMRGVWGAMGDTFLATWGFIPLTTVTLCAATLSVIVYLTCSDRSGRPWGRKEL